MATLGRLSTLVSLARVSVCSAGVGQLRQLLPAAVGTRVGGVRQLSHVPVDDLINGLTEEQIKVMLLACWRPLYWLCLGHT